MESKTLQLPVYHACLNYTGTVTKENISFSKHFHTISTMFGILSASTFQTLLDEVKVHVHVIFNNSYSLIFPIDQKTETPKDFTEKQIKTQKNYIYLHV